MVITVANPALGAHGAHQNEEDIIPAPAEGCPILLASLETTPLPAPGPVPTGEAPAGAETRGGGLQAGARGLGAGPRANGGVGSATPGTALAVAGMEGAAGEPTLAGNPAAAAGEEDEAALDGAASLPFTGLTLLTMAMIGYAAVSCGLIAQRALKRRRREMGA